MTFQIEQLDELITAEGDGAAFFEKTFITQGMQDLLSEGIARLAGASSQAIFHLKQAMGGGKTHLLVGFGLLARHPGLRSTHCAGMPHSTAFKTANIAAFNGRNSPLHFFWGEIASQLGKKEIFQEFWASGPKAPDEKAWLKLFDGSDPVLILLDELPPYFEDLATRPIGIGAERFYLKLIELESRGAKILDNYQNFAKAFKVRDFHALMGDQRANHARLKNAVEFGKGEMNEGSELHQSVLRAVQYAVMELVRNVDGSEVLAHLTLNIANYYGDMTQREIAVQLADYLARRLEALRPEEASAARVLRELIKNQRLG